MGTVWRGYDSVLDREVAVKLIRADVVATPEQADEFAKRFRREARLTARIRHHGVPQVYDAVLDLPYDRVYLVMELVHGEPLRSFIDPDAPLPIPWAAAIGAQVATVLSYAHAAPAVHRDLKPDNIMVTLDGAVKVLDFGIAAILRRDVTRITATGSVVGTTRYMSPEQIKGGQVSPRSDLYALGCILHELVTGRHLFTSDNEFTLMQQHVTVAPTPVRQLRPDAPEALERLILDLLAKAPDQRPADAYAVYRRLLPLLPPPGADPLPAGRAPTRLPDPTRIYRLPNAPRPADDEATAPPQRPRAAATPPPASTRLNDAINAAVAHSDTLLEEERFTQAAEALQQRSRRPSTCSVRRTRGCSGYGRAGPRSWCSAETSAGPCPSSTTWQTPTPVPPGPPASRHWTACGRPPTVAPSWATPPPPCTSSARCSRMYAPRTVTPDRPRSSCAAPSASCCSPKAGPPKRGTCWNPCTRTCRSCSDPSTRTPARSQSSSPASASLTRIPRSWRVRGALPR